MLSFMYRPTFKFSFVFVQLLLLTTAAAAVMLACGRWHDQRWHLRNNRTTAEWAGVGLLRMLPYRGRAGVGCVWCCGRPERRRLDVLSWVCPTSCWARSRRRIDWRHLWTQNRALRHCAGARVRVNDQHIQPRYLHEPQYLHNLISGQPCHNTRSSSAVTLARPPTRSSLEITNRSFQYAAPYLCNQLPPNFVSPARYCLLHVHLISHMVVHLHCHHFHHVSPVLSFTLNLRLGSLANPFHHRPFPYLPDWFYGLSDHLTFLFCSTAGSVSTVC